MHFLDETDDTQGHRAPLHGPSRPQLTDTTNEPMQNYDGSEMRDSNSQLVYKSQFLSTHPLWSDCKERVGYGGKKFTYVSGDGVIRTMNAIFGHGGWSSHILNEKVIQSEKDDRGRWYVGYIATVRVSLLNGSSHEDCGSGEGINESKIKAHEKAIKSAVTDAMKRAARHFGERLGNALYVKGNGIRTAPRTNRDALAELERKDSLNLFGNQAALRSGSTEEKKVAGTTASASGNAEAVRTAVTATLTGSAAAAAAGTQQFAHQNQTSSNNNMNRTLTHSGRIIPPPAPSPIVSRGPPQQQQQKQQQGVVNVNSNLGGNHNNTYMRQQQQQRPTSQMAPPPRPMYNPGNNAAGTTAYQLLNKQQQQQHTSVHTATNTDTMKRSLNSGGDDGTIKRQKLNPYSNNNSRLSV